VEDLLVGRDFQELVSGPYDSRRFGRTLRVNPLPKGTRLCNFDCIYCECLTASWPLDWELRPRFPAAQEVHAALFAETFGPDELDSITIAGNGEPTLSPQLDEIVDVVNAARDRNWPQSRTVILSNGTMCHKPAVRTALAKLGPTLHQTGCGQQLDTGAT